VDKLLRRWTFDVNIYTDASCLNITNDTTTLAVTLYLEISAKAQSAVVYLLLVVVAITVSQ